jgi:hypothetical protein
VVVRAVERDERRLERGGGRREIDHGLRAVLEQARRVA